MKATATINFSSGKTHDLAVKDINKYTADLQMKGLRMMRDANDERILLIPLNSNTIECIKLIPAVEEPVIPKPVPAATEEELKQIRQEVDEAVGEVEEKKDIEEKREDAIAEIMAKSNCRHEPEKLVLHRQVTKTGARYFPVCGFCGKRERYVKADSLSDEEKENAVLWKD